MSVRDAIDALAAGQAPPSLQLVVEGGERQLVLLPSRAEAWLDGHCIARLARSRVGFRLLLLVATRGVGLDRASLFEAVWEGQRYRRSSDNTLRVALSRLRKQLGSALTLDGSPNGGLHLDPAISVWVRRSASELTRVRSEVIGRSALVERVIGATQGEGVVILSGAGGIGKTTVARAAVEAQPERWSRFVQLGSCQSEGEVLCAVADALDLVVRGPAEAILGAALSARSGVLVLDEAEGQELGKILDLASACSELCLLITTRDPPVLRGAVRISVPTLSVDDGVRLFDRRADAAGHPPRPEERGLVRELVERLDAHPLALELAASRCAVLPPKRLLERLSIDLLNEGNTSLRAVLDASWALLDDSARAVLCRCAVFHGGFELEAAEAVADLGQDAPWVVDLLQRLHVLGWVQVDDRGRFHLPELVRRYALERDPAPASARSAWAEWLVDAGRSWVEGLDGRESARCLESLAREQANLVALIQTGEASGRAWAGTFVFALAILRGNVSDALELVQAARQADREAAPNAFRRGRLRFATAQLLRVRGFPAAALEELEGEAPEELQVEFDRARGQALQALGRPMAAEEAFQRGLDGAEDQRARARAREALGVFLITVERLSEAEALLDGAGADFARVGDARGQARTQVNRADVLLHQGKVRRAEEIAEQALEAARGCGDQVVEAYALANLTLARLRLGRPDPETQAEALRIARAIGDKALVQGVSALSPE